jgi:hypothetical protein
LIYKKTKNNKMAEVKKSMISPVGQDNTGYLFHVGGQNFKMTGNVIEQVSNVPGDFQALVSAMDLFTINENGVEFYYDWNAKTRIAKIDESATSNFNKFMALQDKLTFLNENRKAAAVANKTAAVTEVEKEIAIVESKISEIKRGPLAIHYKYVKESNKFFMGSREIIGAETDEYAVTEHSFAMSAIRYEDKQMLKVFEFAAKNFDRYMLLDFVVESIDAGIKVYTMRADNHVYVYRMNEGTKIANFERMLADAAIEYVSEQTGADITFMVEDLLESAKVKSMLREKELNLRYEMISFLNDQRGRLAETNKNIPEIKAADMLLSSEIERISEEINGLHEEENLTRKDGFVNGTLNSDVDSYTEGTEIKVDAMDYTTSGSADLLTVFVNENPIKVEKYRINLPSEETI